MTYRLSYETELELSDGGGFLRSRVVWPYSMGFEAVQFKEFIQLAERCTSIILRDPEEYFCYYFGDCCITKGKENTVVIVNFEDKNVFCMKDIALIEMVKICKDN